MSFEIDFDKQFAMLTNNPPFPWQRELFKRFVAGDFPSTCLIPTGLGKTAVIPIWLLALAVNPQQVPRRLVYVVNRRTVVDQSTGEAEKVRGQLLENPGAAELKSQLSALCATSGEEPLAISTLRGQFADNQEWRADPTRPAIIVGTVDMIGSRLLFSGYGVSWRMRPVHAGLLGQDSLLVHDEAHLEPAFQMLLESIAATQHCPKCGDHRPIRVIQLTATARGTEERNCVRCGGSHEWRNGQPSITGSRSDHPFGLTDQDHNHPTVSERITAKKGMVFHPVEESQFASTLAELALAHRDSGEAILVYVRQLKHLNAVEESLRKAVGDSQVAVLTGTLRGKERDELVKTGVFRRFLPPNHGKPPGDDLDAPSPTEGTVYLICTSAGEVGINISADHLVCDLSPLDSMAQRFGRVNRFGEGDARIDVVHLPSYPEENLGPACERTLVLLQTLTLRPDGTRDASPSALKSLSEGIDDGTRRAAFTPFPDVLHVDDILLDAWSLTTVREELPGRPPVADWLHGVREWEPPETHVAWREEVERIVGGLLAEDLPGKLLDDFPLKPHELLRDSTERVFAELKKLAARSGELPVWLVALDGRVRVTTLGDIAAGDKDELNFLTVLLPPSAGGLKPGAPGLSDGRLHGNAPFDVNLAALYDISCLADLRKRKLLDADESPETPDGMRLVRSIRMFGDDENGDSDEEPSKHAVWYWYVAERATDDAALSFTAPKEQLLDDHLASAESFARRISDCLELPVHVADALIAAARMHDLGKARVVWQRAIRNAGYPSRVLAKSAHRYPLRDLSHYRHEFGSLMQITADPQQHPLADEHADSRDLLLHLIAAHHGRGRPYFPAGEVFDPEGSDELAAQVAEEAILRFSRYQREYGRWGLAWLESLLRAADVLASQEKEGLEA